MTSASVEEQNEHITLWNGNKLLEDNSCLPSVPASAKLQYSMSHLSIVYRITQSRPATRGTLRKYAAAALKQSSL